MEDKKSFGEFITQKRKESRLTQKSFAEKIFVTESAISKWERGISYPDITLISDICEVLKINEHELLTASEDLQTRATEKSATKYVKLVNRYKSTLFFVYGISLLVCFICNLAAQHMLSWFFIVLTAELIAFTLTLLPVLVTNYRGLITLGAFFTSLVLLLMTCCIYTDGDWFLVTFIPLLFGMTVVFLPIILNRIWLPEFLSNKKALLCFMADTVLLLLLIFVCAMYSGGGWFLTKGLPITLFCLIIPWSMMLIIRYSRIDGLLKTSACFAVICVFDYFIEGLINKILGIKPYVFGFQYNFHNWGDEYMNGNIHMIILILLLGMTVSFAIAGIMKSINKRSQNLNTN
ncbi:helix-turn-helix domain-containing protein [Clostridium estertheticum]|uniref:helix-turn-helix domain-containing protein n=1 Tax=Clostridium estertheticum TaxID=238834 RepID=UPI001C7CB553|nr:helix-turn-helix transcriptional regulator [Clostridium estertheticum]MBX4263986.1 helix-turn-helix domain-containing protein [Clostridium estertheticum]WLC87096.1 helix-turn-helix domain-containing protein [Clostridium estertheticum]